MSIKNILCTLTAIIGGGIVYAFGGWDDAIVTLVTFMVIDYATGVIDAAMGVSPKGSLNSRIGWKGLAKKAMTLGIVAVAVRLDIVLATDYIRDMVIIGFTANEGLSILENAALLGVPMPSVVKKALEVMKQKGDEPNG